MPAIFWIDGVGKLAAAAPAPAAEYQHMTLHTIAVQYFISIFL